MEGYIAGVEPATWRGINALKINFSGYNYRYPGFYYPELLEFKEEYLKDIREIKLMIDELSSNSDIAIFNGGEPTLQRQVLISLAKHTKEMGLSNILFTNASKPFTIKTLMDNKLIDIYVVDLPAPLDERFDKVVHASTFFKPAQEIVRDVEKSLELFKNKKEEFGVVFRTKVIPGLVYKTKEFLDIARIINHIDASWELVRFIPQRSVSKVFRGLNAPSQEFIEGLIKEINKHFPELRVDWSDS